MLKTLYISNYALIDRLQVDFDAGLTIITGETGAGKSIIMGALALLLGERASSQTIRDKSSKTVVEATFHIQGAALRPLFEQADLDYADECILRRELSASGRSRAFVNDTPVPLTTLRELATRLVDIHSQHSNMLLATPAFQLDILDAIARNHDALSSYGEQYQAMCTTERELQQLQQQAEKDRAEQDYLSFQCSQLQQLQLAAGEDTQLETLQHRLANASDLKEQLWNIAATLDSEDDSMLQRLKGLVASLGALEPQLEEMAGMSDRVQAALIELKDIATTVSDLQDSLEVNPVELERVENRLNDIYALERKHSVPTVDALLALQHDYERRLADIDNSDERIEQLKIRLDQQRASATALAATITLSRQQAAAILEKQLVEQTAKLGLKNVVFHIDFKAVALNARGADAVEFMMAFNKNQQPMPLRETASGGEMSRVMLSIKSIVAHTMSLPTIIFDEVDTGVSGDTASRMGEMMGDIARTIQVIAITHLPQVASHGHHHFKVYKTDTAHDTVTSLTALDEEQHVLEVARMLSGRQLDQAAIDNAKSLINQNKRT
ncbi:MAG: DNA repair protein RecN [Muribaculaceae bacterium]|nr:DNA repair protein RecN [Muribaculaceae bacterium]